MNKIKSKAYRTIRKRQRTRKERGAGGGGDEGGDVDFEAEGDEEMSAEAREKEAFKRVKERMDMRHSNTGKWAKMALQHGQNDASLKEAYHEQVQLGQELRRKIQQGIYLSRLLLYILIHILSSTPFIYCPLLPLIRNEQFGEIYHDMYLSHLRANIKAFIDQDEHFASLMKKKMEPSMKIVIRPIRYTLYNHTLIHSYTHTLIHSYTHT